MDFTNEITVNIPRSRFIELFDDPENLKHWQKGLLSFEAVSGTPGEARRHLEADLQAGQGNHGNGRDRHPPRTARRIRRDL